MRNESLRLPYFLDYYKNLGVNRFFLIDNNSTDNSVQLALSEEKVHVFETKDNYQNHWFWMEHLLDTYGKEHWCVVVDIDELFSYPYSEHLSLQELRAFLESRNETAIRTFLLDMYSDQSVVAASYSRGENPLEMLNYFDKDYRKISFSFPDRSTGKSYTFEIFTGGMRDRVFGRSNPPSILSKVPFFKNTEGTYLSQGMHAINGATLSDVQGVVFHTKFLSDFITEVEEECQREQHYGNAFYYKIFHQKLKETPDIQFYHEGSVKFENLQQLVELGLMKTTPEFEAFAQAVFIRKNNMEFLY
ncbi:glycosyltransferase family 2 protein [Runella sp. MFBS21]|uniref:glycosyltransferase family 2 protein n=1 Tax=Runella sp. MFBS21 TaxID=3034018 RepID=UPI0023F7D92C|nr:glycosyltransferase family 2 protein [Runella sp. MFBS21]MDF7819550.1 glycosyltransferase family 2 protein [Runella sp. MFBS21]